MFDVLEWPPWTSSLIWTLFTLGFACPDGLWGRSRVKSARDANGSDGVLEPASGVHSRHRATAATLGPASRNLAVVRLLAAHRRCLRLGFERPLHGRGALGIADSGMTSPAERFPCIGRRLAPGLPISSLTQNIAWGLVVGLGLFVVLSGFPGISITPMLTALGVGGLAVALALQEPLSNFFAGLFLALAGRIRVGDYVRLDSGQEGYVSVRLALDTPPNAVQQSGGRAQCQARAGSGREPPPALTRYGSPR